MLHIGLKYLIAGSATFSCCNVQLPAQRFGIPSSIVQYTWGHSASCLKNQWTQNTFWRCLCIVKLRLSSEVFNVCVHLMSVYYNTYTQQRYYEVSESLSHGDNTPPFFPIIQLFLEFTVVEFHLKQWFTGSLRCFTPMYLPLDNIFSTLTNGSDSTKWLHTMNTLVSSNVWVSWFSSSLQLCDNLRNLSDVRAANCFHVPLQETVDSVQVQRGKQWQRLPGPICDLWWWVEVGMGEMWRILVPQLRLCKRFQECSCIAFVCALFVAEDYQELIEDIVRDGRLYASENHQEILKV